MTLDQLSAAATGGEWELRHDDEIWGNEGHGDIQLVTAHSIDAAFIVALVNAYRTGQLVAVADDAVDRVARAIGTSLAYDIGMDVRAGSLTDDEKRKVATKAIAAMKDTQP